jgi:hypothetical protein
MGNTDPPKTEHRNLKRWATRPHRFWWVRVAHLFSFLFCVFGGVCVAHLFSFLFCIFWWGPCWSSF